MKNIARISAIALIALFITSVSFAGTKKFSLYLNEGTAIEVLSKTENLVDEYLPIVSNAVCKSKSPEVFVLTFEVKEEQLVEEEIITEEFCHTQLSDEYMVALVRTLSKTENEVDDLDFDTKAVVEEYKATNAMVLTAEDIKPLTKPEYEVFEDFLVSNSRYNKAK